MNAAVRPLTVEETPHVINYFLQSDDAHLRRLGVDISKLPTFDDWHANLQHEFAKPVRQRALFYVGWELDGQLIGHSHINDIVLGQQAFMHLHIWQTPKRHAGLGRFFVRKSAEIYFDQFDLQTLLCQPAALNTAPNRTLQSVGFRYVKTYETKPSWINIHHAVTLWQLQRNSLPQQHRGTLAQPPT